MRLIDADKLKQDAELCRETTDAFIELIDKQPDAVVRCPGCVYKNTCISTTNGVEPDGFCKWGETVTNIYG